MVETLARFVADLANASIGETTNHYSRRQAGLDRPNAPGIRTENLLGYLEARSDASLVLVGEAAGYRGCRFSGIPFTSERSLPVGRWTSTRAQGWREPSATIVHRVLHELGLEEKTLLWNAVPTHPAGSRPLSNRTPTRAELALGICWLERLLSLTEARSVVAVGRAAASVLPSGTPVVRHPANGGAALFRRQLADLVMRNGQAER